MRIHTPDEFWLVQIQRAGHVKKGNYHTLGFSFIAIHQVKSILFFSSRENRLDEKGSQNKATKDTVDLGQKKVSRTSWKCGVVIACESMMKQAPQNMIAGTWPFV